MPSLRKSAAICLLAATEWAGDAIGSEPRKTDAAGSPVARGDYSSQSSAGNTESWRTVYKDRVWWYWTAQDSWMVWNGANWVHSPAARDTAGRGLSNRFFSYLRQPIDSDDPRPSQQQVNSAGESGLGYEGLAIPTKKSARLPVQVITGQHSSSTYTLSPEEQVHSAGETGLGYEGLR